MRQTQERMMNMCNGKTLTVAVILAVLIGANAHAEDWKVGEKWIYKHEGPRPFATASTEVKGDRTAEVMAIKGEGPNKRYVLKSVWGTEDQMPTMAYIDPNNLLRVGIKVSLNFFLGKDCQFTHMKGMLVYRQKVGQQLIKFGLHLYPDKVQKFVLQKFIIERRDEILDELDQVAIQTREPRRIENLFF